MYLSDVLPTPYSIIIMKQRLLRHWHYILVNFK